ncbi:MAG: hypothetical protein MR902_03075 [Campylobacter sp.]|nr:hypothetical protein [Campylobacter sp.]
MKKLIYFTLFITLAYAITFTYLFNRDEKIEQKLAFTKMSGFASFAFFSDESYARHFDTSVKGEFLNTPNAPKSSKASFLYKGYKNE